MLAGSLRQQYRQLFHRAEYDLHFTTQYGGATEDPFLDLDQQDNKPHQGVVFTTIDQVLSSFIGVPLGVPRRLANVVHGSVLSGALVFDEFHLLESGKSFDTALHLLRQSPWPVLVMTATMSGALRRALCDWLGAEEVVVDPEEDLPLIPSQRDTSKRVSVHDAPLDGKKVVDRLGKRTLVICNRVERAQQVYRDVCDELRGKADAPKVMLLHSRFLPSHRTAKERLLQRWFRKNSQERAVLVATQVVEAGLDISCDVMHTEASPIDSFLQRIGRAARFEGEASADVHVYLPPETEKRGAFLPYCKSTTLATLDVLRANPTLQFADLQGLIDDILTEEQVGWMRRVEGGATGLRDRIHTVRWKQDRAATKELVRDIDNAEVVVAEPDEVLAAGASPYSYSAIGVRVSTLRHRFLKSGGEAHAVKDHVDEVEGDRYFTLLPVGEDDAWPSLRLVIPPGHAAYDRDLGLQLGTPGDHVFSPEQRARERFVYDYEKEPYHEHIERLYKYDQVREAPLAALARLSTSSRSPIRVNDPERVIDLVIWAHDLAKLSDGWQHAHGDHDLRFGKDPLAHGGRLEGKKPPPHAAESACAAYGLLDHLLRKTDEPDEVWLCALATIRTHHGGHLTPEADAVKPYRIRPERQAYLCRVTPDLRPAIASDLLAAFDEVGWVLEREQPQDWHQEYITYDFDALYALLSYMLRRSDQLATAEVSNRTSKPVEPDSPVQGISNIIC